MARQTPAPRPVATTQAHEVNIAGHQIETTAKLAAVARTDIADLTHASGIDNLKDLPSPIRDLSVDEAHTVDGTLDLDDAQAADHIDS